uniref:Extended synaptotagmin-like protein 1a n=1 Tax=Gasterosteus aculeatus aculeatus TaxID=481459 RepID=A0AAQ4QKJ9_GASAC
MRPATAEPGAGIAAPALPIQTPGERALSVLWSFAKCLAALLPVYLAGYYGFSISVVLFGLMIYMGWKHSRLEKVTRLKLSMFLQENEKAFTTQQAFRTKRDLPPWVDFPDVEKVEWLNKILQQAWPFIGQYLEKLLVETIAPAIRMSSIHLQTLSFTKVNIGDKALKVVGVKAHTENDKRQVMLDLYLSYAGDVEVNVEIKKYFCKAGVKGVQLHGKLRVILEPLIGDVPLVGAITMFFIRRPKLDINWTGLTNLLDIPGLNAISDTMIMDAIASHLVLPNRLTIPLVADLHVAQLRSPLPRGVVRIHLLEAEDLTAKDTVIKGLIDGKSDPYAVLRVGTQIFTSHHVDSNLNPQWREMYEVIVHEVPGQELEVEVFDKDPDQDDFLGRDVQTGSVHLRLEWLSLLSSADRLSEVSCGYSSLCTQLSMRDRPLGGDVCRYNLNPLSPVKRTRSSSFCSLLQTCYGTNGPVWEDAFTFFIQDPSKQDIDIQVKDDDRALSLGSLSIPLSRLLAAPELTMDQWFQLENSGSASRIYIKIVLRVGSPHIDLSAFFCTLTLVGIVGKIRFMQFGKEPNQLFDTGSQCESHVPASILRCVHCLRCEHCSFFYFYFISICSLNIQRHPYITDHMFYTVFRAESTNSAGQVKLTVGYSVEESRLFITIHSCRALAACSKDGADPYVSFILLPDKKATTKRRTATKKRDLNPEFNERFDFDFSLEESTQRRLDLSVKNSVSFMSRERELIGKLDLDQIDLKAGITQW